VQEHVFDPFFTTKPAGVGTGLGLSICHRIVSELQGSIAVESAPGEGSLFRVTLPASERPITREPKAPRPSQKPARKRVLLVDDEVLITKTLKMLLDDYDVTIANCGADAVGHLGRESFDVVLCDVMMPDMSGADVYRYVLGEKPELAKRFIFMTGDALRSFAVGLPVDEGAWLEKPFAGETVLAALERVLAAGAG
jgi:CheY-like chemotaxis protein